MTVILQIPVNAKGSTYIIVGTYCDFAPATIQFKVVAFIRRRTDLNLKPVGKSFLRRSNICFTGLAASTIAAKSRKTKSKKCFFMVNPIPHGHIQPWQFLTTYSSNNSIFLSVVVQSRNVSFLQSPIQSFAIQFRHLHRLFSRYAYPACRYAKLFY